MSLIQEGGIAEEVKNLDDTFSYIPRDTARNRMDPGAKMAPVFAAQSNDMGGTLVRSVGLVRAKARIGLKNLAYNMRRLVQLERLAAAV